MSKRIIETLPDGARPIPGFTSYYCTPTGEIYSYRRRPPKLMTPFKTPGGYLRVNILRDADGVNTTKYVGPLVLETFFGPRPSPHCEAAHLNGIKTDNRLENLQWKDREGNSIDKIRHRYFVEGAERGVLSEEGVRILLGRLGKVLVEVFGDTV